METPLRDATALHLRCPFYGSIAGLSLGASGACPTTHLLQPGKWGGGGGLEIRLVHDVRCSPCEHRPPLYQVMQPGTLGLCLNPILASLPGYVFPNPISRQLHTCGHPPARAEYQILHELQNSLPRTEYSRTGIRELAVADPGCRCRNRWGRQRWACIRRRPPPVAHAGTFLFHHNVCKLSRQPVGT